MEHREWEKKSTVYYRLNYFPSFQFAFLGRLFYSCMLFIPPFFFESFFFNVFFFLLDSTPSTWFFFYWISIVKGKSVCNVFVEIEFKTRWVWKTEKLNLSIKIALFAIAKSKLRVGFSMEIRIEFLGVEADAMWRENKWRTTYQGSTVEIGQDGHVPRLSVTVIETFSFGIWLHGV